MICLFIIRELPHIIFSHKIGVGMPAELLKKFQYWYVNQINLCSNSLSDSPSHIRSYSRVSWSVM